MSLPRDGHTKAGCMEIELTLGGAYQVSLACVASAVQGGRPRGSVERLPMEQVITKHFQASLNQLTYSCHGPI